MARASLNEILVPRPYAQRTRSQSRPDTFLSTEESVMTQGLKGKWWGHGLEEGTAEAAEQAWAHPVLLR